MNRPHLPRSADDRAFWAAWLGTLAVVVGIAFLIRFLSRAAEWGVL
ncbi:hypothetical protein IU421_14970 [Nocardia cyriacigeorgica]|nr:hypothetical protein [Nocardia cyriacigeorgica]MBF6515573.1 hypothetical protein [Nocardia cyriacigeorgica]